MRRRAHPKFGRKDAGILALLVTAALLLIAFCPGAAKHSHVHFGDDGTPFSGVIVGRRIELPAFGRFGPPSTRGPNFQIHYMIEVREKNGNWRRVPVPFALYVNARSGGRLVRDTTGGVCYLADR